MMRIELGGALILCIHHDRIGCNFGGCSPTQGIGEQRRAQALAPLTLINR